MAVVLTDVGAPITPRIEPVDGASDAAHLYKIKLVRITGDAAYPTNGSPLTAAMVGLTRIDFVQVDPVGGFVPAYDYAASKLKVFQDQVAAGALTELANATNNSATVYPALIIGV